MRIEIHVKSLEDVAAIQAQYADSTDEIVIIVGASSPKSADRQERKQAVGNR